MPAATHGHSRKNPVYKTWAGIKQRCNNPKEPAYPHYGARGIKMCDKWERSYLAFYEYIGERPSNKHTIERIDNNRGYEPGNVRWATRDEQQHNRRPYGKLGVKGVYENRYGYQAKIKAKSGHIYLGTYKSIIEASRAYQKAAKEHYAA